MAHAAGSRMSLRKWEEGEFTQPFTTNNRDITIQDSMYGTRFPQASTDIYVKTAHQTPTSVLMFNMGSTVSKGPPNRLNRAIRGQNQMSFRLVPTPKEIDVTL